MLVKYQRSARKIGMGLLSFMPNGRKINTLNQTMEKYEESVDWQLYLWKERADYIGLIGIEIQEHTITVHHVTVSPSFRNEGIGHKMIEELKKLDVYRAMQSTVETRGFLAKCWQTKSLN